MESVTSTFIQILSLVASSIIVIVLTALFVFSRKLIGLPKEMIIVKAALFRALRSNKSQGMAIKNIALAMKEGTANGRCDEAVRVVTEDEDRTDRFLLKAAMGHTDVLDDVMKESED